MSLLRIFFVLLAVQLLAACSGGSPDELLEGPWHAWLDSPGGPLPFEMKLVREGDAWSVSLFNGAERIEVSRVESAGRKLTLGIDPYDATIEAAISGDGARLDGAWRKTTAAEATAELPFHATAGARPRFDGVAPSADGTLEIVGRWSVRFASDEEPAIGLFETGPDGTLHGTFLTTTGDYRYLAGSFENGLLRLSGFDGAHAFLFHARLENDGSLAGDFWSRDSWHDTWTAVRDARAALPDPFSLTSPIDGVDLAELAYPDLDGSRRSLADPELAGPVRVVELFGTWCPNCNDATRYLAELHQRYRDRGLVVVGLAFELTGEFQRDSEQVRSYALHHGLEYPLLLAGRYGRDEASRSFPLIDRIRAYPTTLFLDAGGRVRAVHTGFAGPATGESHRRLREDFERWIEALLDEAGSGS